MVSECGIVLLILAQRKCPEKIDNTYVLDKEEFAASLLNKRITLECQFIQINLLFIFT
jgi:hypothetical protein